MAPKGLRRRNVWSEANASSRMIFRSFEEHSGNYVEHDPQGKPRITLQKIQIERLLYIVILCATLTFFEVKPWLVRQWACA